MINFDTPKRDLDVISQIADRADELGIGYNRMDMIMDFDAVNTNSCKLNFYALLRFLDSDFTHDVCGIHKHIDRATGQLTDGFSPRCTI
jgi:hypothetical protein